MKNSEDNNYGIRFKSKTEAIEQLCLKVFGAIPVYESSLEELKEETLESMYAKVVAVAMECDPIPAKDRADGKIEPPWEVFARVKRELTGAQNLLKQCLSAMPVGYIPTHTAENLPEMIGDLAKALAEETTERENLELALATVTKERDADKRRLDWLALNGGEGFFTPETIRQSIDKDSQSCPECDAHKL